MKRFNNLRDSILTLCFFLINTMFFIFCIIKLSDTLKVDVILFIMMAILDAPLIYYLITGCFGYYIIKEDQVVSKKLFCKKKIIFLKEIQKVERCIVDAFVLGIYKSEAYVIQDYQKRITILIDSKTDNVVTEILDEYGYLQKLTQV